MEFRKIKDVLDDFFNLVQVFKDITPRDGRTRTRGYFSAVKVSALTTCMLFTNFLNFTES